MEPHQEYMEPHQENMEPYQEYMEPYQEYKKPLQEYMEPHQQYMEPHQEYMEPHQEYMEPLQEYMEPLQEYLKPRQEAVHSQQPPPKEDTEHYIQQGVRGSANQFHQAEVKTEPSLRHILSSPLKKYPKKAGLPTPIHIDSPDHNANPMPAATFIPTAGTTPTLHSIPSPTATSSLLIISTSPVASSIPTPTATPTYTIMPTISATSTPFAHSSATSKPTPTPQQLSNQAKDDLKRNEEFALPVQAAENVELEIEGTADALQYDSINADDDEHDLVDHLEDHNLALASGTNDQTLSIENSFTPDGDTINQDDSALSQDDHELHYLDPIPDGSNQEDLYLYDFDQFNTKSDPKITELERHGPQRVPTKISSPAPPSIEGVTQIKRKDPKYVRPSPELNSKQVKASDPDDGLDLSNTESHTRITHMDRSGPQRVKPSTPVGSDPPVSNPVSTASDLDHDLDLSDTDSHTRITQLDRSGPRRVQPSTTGGSDPPSSNPVGSDPPSSNPVGSDPPTASQVPSSAGNFETGGGETYIADDTAN